jgi:hypothetical protein
MNTLSLALIRNCYTAASNWARALTRDRNFAIALEL